MKTSKYKDKIIDILKKNHLLSLSEINSLLPEANFSTIYRNIEILETENIIRSFIKNKNEILYEYIDHSHEHDHLICDNCGDIQSIHIDKKKLNLKGDFKLYSLTMHGKCKDCI